MLRRGLMVALVILVAGQGATGRDDDEPTFFDKKLSYWLKQLQEGKDARARRGGLLAVEQIGHARSRKVVPALVKAMREDKDEKVRAAAARAVGRAVAKAFEQARADKKDELPRFDDARDALASTLRTEKADPVREAAAAALGDIGPDARGAVGALAVALKDRHAATVRAAASALRRMGKDAKEAQAELQAVVGNSKEDLDARTEAAVALGLIDADVAQALPVMRKVVGDAKADTKLRKAVAEALGKWGKDAGDASATLGLVLVTKTTPVELRTAAVTALSQFGAEAKEAIPALIRAVDDNDNVVRCLAMQTLGQLGRELGDHREKAVKAILKGTEASNIEVAVSAVETLGGLAPDGLGSEVDEVIKRLDAILKREGRKALREAAQAARDKIRPPKKAKG
jgi:HEAT repeat protein